MERFAPILRACAEKAALPTVKALAARPGMKAVYRVTIYHADWRAADVVVTIKHGTETVREIVYVGCFENKPLIRKMTPADYQAFVALVGTKTFDHLSDQAGTAPIDADVCLFERAAGTFVKSVIFTPQTPSDAYTPLVEAIRQFMPEAEREIAR
ncbi:MAG: hypothetical protein OHK0046_26950 [Anaerolineae bacterium]